MRAFSRHLRKHPLGDDEIISGLEWVERIVYMIRTGEQINEGDTLRIEIDRTPFPGETYLPEVDTEPREESAAIL